MPRGEHSKRCSLDAGTPQSLESRHPKERVAAVVVDLLHPPCLRLVTQVRDIDTVLRLVIMEAVGCNLNLQTGGSGCEENPTEEDIVDRALAVYKI